MVSTTTTTTKTDSGKSVRTECTGEALDTVKKHERDEDLTLFGACFSPFVQRVWVALEVFEFPYKVGEVDLIKRPRDSALLEISPKGLVPALKLNNFNPPKSLNESTVILEYINDLAETTMGKSLLPPATNPYARALVRLQCHHINHSILPAYYRYLQAQDQEVQISTGKEYHESINEVADAAGQGEKKTLAVGLGLWIDGNEDIGLADVMVGPWLYRSTTVLKYYRGFELPEGRKFNNWLHKLLNHPVFKKTNSTDDLYLESNEGNAFNRSSSQITKAVNSGRELP
ncbi:hypothetical protein GYMLUDRAFT_168585 [Collybiopsis luxurians FD-317 M1]|uniref:Glutathione transferase n=1 Tax=Collybiopsis luxurians FD-317 M1 TaxID=944289 RepID=A0A0D0CC30_9AGAR|nr:hypothetical protein GYMLUDRAFT_168585 [Collybiopsis luxurians FD-317 M1]